MCADDQSLQELEGAIVVVDTDSTFVHVGRLVSCGSCWIELEEVDVHNLGEGGSTREVYLIQTKRLGVHKNREKVFVPRARVVSLSRLEDIIEY